MTKSLKHLVLGAVLAIPAALTLSVTAVADANVNAGDTPPGGYSEEACDCSAIDSATSTTAGSLNVTISVGRSPLGQLSPGKLVLYAQQPSASLFTPAHLMYSHDLSLRVDSVTTSGLAQGISCQVVIITPRQDKVVYQFATGSSVGYPTGKFSMSSSTLTMCDASGAPVTSTPVQFRFGTRDSKAATVFSAAPPYSVIAHDDGHGSVVTATDIQLEIIRDAAGSMRQIKSAFSLADIVVPAGMAGKGFEVRFYNPDQVGAKNADGTYAVSGNPFSVTSITNTGANPGPTDVDHLRVTRTANGTTDVSDYTYTDAQKQWTLVTGGGLRKEVVSRVRNPGTGMIQETREVYNAAGQRVSSEITVKQPTANGYERVVSQTRGVGGITQATQSFYWDDASAGMKYNRVKASVNPDGSWVMFDYDAQGRCILEVHPTGDLAWDTVKSMAPSEASVIGQATSYDYTPLDANDTVTSDDARPRTITETAHGIIAGIAYHVYKTVNEEVTEISERATSQGAVYGATGNQRTTTVYYASTAGKASAGKPKSVTHPDGKVTSYSYELGNFQRGDDFVRAPFTAPGSYLWTTVETTPLVAGKSVRSLTISGMGGKTVHEETQVLTVGGTWEQLSWTGHQLNLRGQVTAAVSSNGSRTDTTWGCCNKESETDASGTQTFYYYDALKRLTQAVTKGSGSQPDRTVAQEYDANNNVTKTTASAGSLSLVSTTEYDGLGRVTKTTDAAGLVTTYAYSADGRTTTVTQPGGGTVVTTKYIDGRTKSVSGTAVPFQHNEYGINPDGTGWSKSYTGSGNEAAWRKNTGDFLRHTVLTEMSGIGGSVVSTVYSYDPITDHLIKIETKSAEKNLVAPTLYIYDNLGILIRTGFDVNEDNTLVPASMDHIKDNDSFYEKDTNGIWWAKQVSKTYPTANDATAITVAMSYSQTTGLGTDQGDGFILAALAKSVDIRGNEIVSKTLVNRASKTVKQVTASPFSSSPSVQIAVNGLTVSQTTDTGLTYTVSYDALGRQTGSTDPRTGTAVTHYNDKGQVDYVQDAAGNQTKFTYDLTTGRQTVVENALGKKKYMAYDIKGQLTRTWGDTDYPTENVYDEFGRLVNLKTFRSPGSAGSPTGGDAFMAATWPADPGTADVTTWVYDAATGLLLQKTYADGNGPTYTYDAAGRPATRTWSRFVVPPSGGAPVPLVTTYAYSPTTGELTGITYSDSTPAISFSYDRLGRQATVTDVAGTRTFAYSASDLQLDSETLPAFLGNRMLTRQRDTLGRPAGYQLLNGPAIETQAGYAYDAYGRTASVTDVSPNGQNTPAAIATYAYLANSNLLATTTFANGVTATRSYEEHRDLITSVENKVGQTFLSVYTYTNDAIGRRTSMAKSGTAFAQADQISYGYNTRSEVTSAVSANDTNYNYGYNFDPIGNRLTATEAGTAKTYTSNALNQYSAIQSVQSVDNPSYDLDGNQLTLKNDKGDWTFTWNAENRLIAAESATQRLEFAYDYMGRRISKKLFTVGAGVPPALTSETRFIYDGYTLIAEYSVLNSVFDLLRSYTWDPTAGQATRPLTMLIPQSIDHGPQTFYYTHDANKNVSELTDSASAVVAHYEYAPWGNLVAFIGIMADQNIFRFSSEYIDAEDELVYYINRYYDEKNGQWISRDPVGVRGGLNVYGFCYNIPIIYTDYLGFGVITKGDCSPSWPLPPPNDSCTRSGGIHPRSCDNVCCCGNRKFDPLEKCCDTGNKIVDKVKIYVINRLDMLPMFDGENTGTTGGHIDLVLPELGLIGFYAGATSLDLCNLELEIRAAIFGLEGHLNVGMDWTENKKCQRPGYVAAPNSPYRRKETNGSVSEFNNSPALICELTVCPAQAREMVKKARNIQKDPPRYFAVGKNCSTVGCDILSAGGILPDGISWIDNPKNLIDQLVSLGGSKFFGYTCWTWKTSNGIDIPENANQINIIHLESESVWFKLFDKNK